MFGSLIDPLNAPAPEEDMSDEASGDIPFRGAGAPTNGTDDQEEPSDNGEENEEDEEDGEDEEEGVYVVEDILSHEWLDGTLKLLVKWQGYESEKDQTWEDEEGLMDGAAEIVNSYYDKIGGRPEEPERKPAPKGRKRKSMGDAKTPTPAKTNKSAGAKRQRKSTPKKAAKHDTPHLKKKNLTGSVDTIVREGDQGLMAWLEFNNGRKTRIPVQVCYERCPLKMLKFYESHLVFKDI
ncbi:uncharacterized protein N7515_005593 [Penicillium bovifimosum]|uniref:Chromo domain-containing protein n=1 Tax=Penicillium bovifimosum TaxID=126998 RepID=A0A9W9GT01_9EURO|nr:uncharacterized protein N7515_005593 [Penicillium bovifimosum]KAJ5129554.1 hypothetical protein N7515_005593 [Penicillium bovifimosum]